MKIGTSPITGTIYAGSTRRLKTGQEVWSKKEDVTEMCIGAVAESLLASDEIFSFQIKGKRYELKVVEVVE